MLISKKSTSKILEHNGFDLNKIINKNETKLNDQIFGGNKRISE